MNSSEEIRARFRDRLNSPIADPILEVKKFLSGYFADCDSYEEGLAEVRSMAEQNDRSVRRGLSALGMVLALPDGEANLLELVALDANFSLDNPGPEGSRAWLEKVMVDVDSLLSDVEGGKASG